MTIKKLEDDNNKNMQDIQLISNLYPTERRFRENSKINNIVVFQTPSWIKFHTNNPDKTQKMIDNITALDDLGNLCVK